MEETMMAAVLYAPGDLKVEKVPLPKLMMKRMFL
jgi:hypothetical protein